MWYVGDVILQMRAVYMYICAPCVYAHVYVYNISGLLGCDSCIIGCSILVGCDVLLGVSADPGGTHTNHIKAFVPPPTPRSK